MDDLVIDRSTLAQHGEFNWCICPVITVAATGERIVGHGVRGSAFLLDLEGGRLLGVTVRHAVEGLKAGQRAALLISNGDGFRSLLVSDIEHHPTEDLALLQLASDRPVGDVRLSPSADRFPIGHDYAVMGYPDDDYWRGDGRVTLELTYSAGHLRRHRGPAELPGIRGANLLELSQRAGGGCSGAPLFARPTLQDGESGTYRVFGLYVGERTSSQGDVAPLTFGYALPFSVVADWHPRTLDGKPLFI